MLPISSGHAPCLLSPISYLWWRAAAYLLMLPIFYLLSVVAQADDHEVVQALMQQLTHKDAIVRQRAALSLAPLNLAPNSNEALETLCALADEDWNDDFKKAALTSIASLCDFNLDRAIESLIRGSESDEQKIK
jgi:hypothetical protein